MCLVLGLGLPSQYRPEGFPSTLGVLALTRDPSLVPMSWDVSPFPQWCPPWAGMVPLQSCYLFGPAMSLEFLKYPP